MTSFQIHSSVFLAHLFYFVSKRHLKKVPAPARSSYRSRDGSRERGSAESVPGWAVLKFWQGCRSQREEEGGGNKVNIGMDIRRQELILFHEKSTLSPLSLPPRIPQPGVSPAPFSFRQLFSTLLCLPATCSRFAECLDTFLEKILGQPTPVFLPGASHGQRSLAGYSPQGLKESDMTRQLNNNVHYMHLL